MPVCLSEGANRSLRHTATTSRRTNTNHYSYNGTKMTLALDIDVEMRVINLLRGNRKLSLPSRMRDKLYGLI